VGGGGLNSGMIGADEIDVGCTLILVVVGVDSILAAAVTLAPVYTTGVDVHSPNRSLIGSSFLISAFAALLRAILEGNNKPGLSPSSASSSSSSSSTGFGTFAFAIAAMARLTAKVGFVVAKAGVFRFGGGSIPNSAELESTNIQLFANLSQNYYLPSFPAQSRFSSLDYFLALPRVILIISCTPIFSVLAIGHFTMFR
jgi:hypothetical protein